MYLANQLVAGKTRILTQFCLNQSFFYTQVLSQLCQNDSAIVLLNEHRAVVLNVGADGHRDRCWRYVGAHGHLGRSHCEAGWERSGAEVTFFIPPWFPQ